MSYTTLLGVTESGDVESICEYRNGWGAGPYIWHVIFERKMGIGAWATRPEIISSKFIPRLGSKADAWALALTFDNLIVRRDDAPIAARYLREFLDGPGQDGSRVNHWPAILKVLEDMPSGCCGIAINHTSVYDGPLLTGVPIGEYEHRPYNVNVDDEHMFLTDAKVDSWMVP